jgi:Uncharacterized protein conserved in bacteria (DUF2125)
MPAKPRRAGRRASRALLLAALLLAVVAAGGGHALLWHRACDRLADGFAAWTATRRAEGWGVTHDPPRRGGWPFAATLAVPQFRLEAGAGLLPGGSAEWRPEAAVVLRVSPPRLDRLVVEMPGRHTLRLEGVSYSASAAALEVVLPLTESADPGEALVAEARGLRFDTPSSTVETRAASLRIGTPGGGDEGRTATALRLSATDMALPPGLPGTARLGAIVERIGLELLLIGPIPTGRDPARRAAAWRDNGGALEVRSLEARWGDVVGSAAAALALDGALQPAGSGTLHVAGSEALLEVLGEAGLLSPFSAAAARVALRALNRAPPGGGSPQAELPLVLRNRSLNLGGIPLARLPLWDWAAGRWTVVPEVSRSRN